MGFLDKVTDAVADHADEAEKVIDKAADLVDDKTGGKYDDQIGTGVDKAKDVIADLEKNDK
mgnify:CR=1 FL=1